MFEKIYVARQPILDRNRELFGYELLFRGKNTDSAGIIFNDINATAKVLDNVLNNIGVDKIVGKSFAFLNCSYEFLLTEIPLSLNPDIFVLEILESVEVNAKIIEVIKHLSEKKFKIAIDDFVPIKENFSHIAPIIPYLTFCKLEYSEIKAGDIDLLRKITDYFHKYNVQVLAEKVETEADFKLCYEAGIDLFQGYFFTKPETIKSVKIDSDSIGVLRILNMINNDMDIMEIEKEFKKHPDLTLSLLKYLNSAAFAMRSRIISIRHALSLLGVSNIKRWLLISTYANANMNFEKSPLLANVVMRASFFEEVAKKLNWSVDKVEKAYLMGLISHLDALYQTSLDNVLEQISLDREITLALLEKKGTMGLLVSLICIIESNEYGDIDKILDDLTLSSQDVSDCLNSAYENSVIAS